MDLDYIPEDPEDWEFSGFKFTQFDDVIELFEAWRDHGVMPYSGGYYDQPAQWDHDMKICKHLFGTKVAEVLLEIRTKQDARKQPNPNY